MRAASIATATRVAAAGNGIGVKQPVAYSILSEQVFTAASQFTREAGGTAAITTSTTAPTPAGQTSYVHVTGNGYAGSNYAFAFSGPWDFTDCFFRFMVRCQVYGLTQGYYIRFATSAATYAAGNYLSMRVAPGNAAPNWLPPATWVWDGFDPLLMSTVGTGASLSSIGFIGFASQDASSSQTCDWDFGRIQRVQKVGTKAKCVIWHDDSVASGYAAIKARLDAYGWAGTEANEWGAMDTGPTFLGAADLVTAKAAGWHIGTHAFTPPEHTGVNAAQFANQMLRAKTFAARYGLGGDAIDFAYWGGLGSDVAYPQLQRMCRTGRFYTSALQQPETQPPADPHIMKAFGAGGGETFATHWKPILQNAITTKGLAQLVFHQQIGSDSSQAAEFDAMLAWLDQNRANIDVVSFGAAIAPMLVGYVPGVVTAPTALNLSAFAGNGQVVISRTGGVGSGVGYKLYRGNTATGTPIATSLPFTDTGLTNGTAISYVATATNTAGTVTSNVVTVTPTAPRDPSTITGLIARYRADSITGVAGGGNVASWPDSSGNSNAATNSTTGSTQPTFVTGLQNGRAAVRFNAATSTQLASAASTSDANQTVIAIVAIADAAHSFTIRGASAPNGLQVSIVNGKPTNVAQNTKALGASSTTMTTAASVAISTFASASGSTWRVNGTAAGSSSTTQSLAAGLTTVIGRNVNQPNEFLSGDLYELLVFNKILSAAEQAYVDSYVQDYFAIAVSDYS